MTNRPPFYLIGIPIGASVGVGALHWSVAVAFFAGWLYAGLIFLYEDY